MGDPNVVNDGAGSSKGAKKDIQSKVNDGAGSSKGAKKDIQSKVNSGARQSKSILKKSAKKESSTNGTETSFQEEVGSILKKGTSGTEPRVKDKEFITLYVNCKTENNTYSSPLNSHARVTRTRSVVRRNWARPHKEGKECLTVYKNPSNYDSAQRADLQECVAKRGVAPKKKAQLSGENDNRSGQLTRANAKRSVPEPKKEKMKSTPTYLPKCRLGRNSNLLETAEADDSATGTTTTVVHTTPSDEDLDDRKGVLLARLSSPSLELFRGNSYDSQTQAIRAYSMDVIKAPVGIGSNEIPFDAGVQIVDTTANEKFSAYPEKVHRMVLERFKKYVAEDQDRRERTPPASTKGGTGADQEGSPAHKTSSVPVEYPARTHVLQAGASYCLARYSRGVTSGYMGHLGIGSVTLPLPTARAVPDRPKKKETTDEDDPRFQVDAYFHPRPRPSTSVHASISSERKDAANSARRSKGKDK